jgi:hypothetical protein
MANPTTYFGWVMPTATDLVTDLPADFNVFGQGVDTSMQDLLGGTTGQVLSKTSNTNMDFTWVNGGMSNPMTTTGDTIYSSSGSTPARLGIGSSGQVLTVAAGVPSWATAAAPSFAGCLITGNAGITLTNNADTTITWNTELFDTNAFHSTATNTERITIPVAGKYKVYFQHYIAAGGAGERASTLFLNNTYYAITAAHASATNIATVNTMSLTMNLAVNDYLDTRIFQDSGANRTLNTSDATWKYSWFGVDYLGA